MEIVLYLLAAVGVVSLVLGLSLYIAIRRTKKKIRKQLEQFTEDIIHVAEGLEGNLGSDYRKTHTQRPDLN